MTTFQSDSKSKRITSNSSKHSERARNFQIRRHSDRQSCRISRVVDSRMMLSLPVHLQNIKKPPENRNMSHFLVNRLQINARNGAQIDPRFQNFGNFDFLPFCFRQKLARNVPICPSTDASYSFRRIFVFFRS